MHQPRPLIACLLLPLAAALFCSLAAPARAQPATVVPLLIFAGQSNMVGLRTDIRALTAEERALQPAALFFGPNDDGVTWAPLAPPTQVEQVIAPEGGFGPELSACTPALTWRVHTLVAAVKLAYGSTSLAADWSPQREGGLYRLLLGRVALAEQRFRAQYPDARLSPAGFFWLQGESDALSAVQAEAYERNLHELIKHIRADLGEPELPVVVGRIRREGGWPYAEQVRTAQEHVAAALPRVALVDTDRLELDADMAHFSSRGTLTLGRLMGEAYVALVRPGRAYLPLLGGP